MKTEKNGSDPTHKLLKKEVEPVTNALVPSHKVITMVHVRIYTILKQ
jgi:hypothetical protein